MRVSRAALARITFATIVTCGLSPVLKIKTVILKAFSQVFSASEMSRRPEGPISSLSLFAGSPSWFGLKTARGHTIHVFVWLSLALLFVLTGNSISRFVTGLLPFSFGCSPLGAGVPYIASVSRLFLGSTVDLGVDFTFIVLPTNNRVLLGAVAPPLSVSRQSNTAAMIRRRIIIRLQF